MSTPPPPSPPAFDQHLSRLRDARRQADEAVLLLGAGHRQAGSTLEQTWQFLFDYLLAAKDTDPPPSLADLNTTAGIIYKLSQSATHLKSLEQKTRDYEEEFLQRMNAALSNVSGLTPELREQIERELKLLS